jgi:hypothetical protein
MLIKLLIGFFIGSFLVTLFNIVSKYYLRYWLYIKEYNRYISQLLNKRTKFKKRINDLIYIEYGIERNLTINIKNNEINFYFFNENIKYRNKVLNYFLIKKTLSIYKNKITDSINYKGNLLDKKSVETFKLIFDISKNK